MNDNDNNKRDKGEVKVLSIGGRQADWLKGWL